MTPLLGKNLLKVEKGKERTLQFAVPNFHTETSNGPEGEGNILSHQASF